MIEAIIAGGCAVLVAVIGGLFAAQKKATAADWAKIEKILAAQHKAQEERDKHEQKLMSLLVTYAGAVMDLSETTAMSIMKDSPNDSMKDALDAAKKARKETRNFLEDIGIGYLYH